MVGLATKPGTGLSQRFTRDEADYTISYSIKAALGLTPIDKALADLETWRTSKVAGKFTKINKTTMLTEIAARLKNPELMDQAKTPLCGPLTILMALAQQDPQRYVAMAKSMYETGKFTLRGKTIQPDSHLYPAAVPAGSPHVDWMLSASMRDAENALFDYEPGDAATAITLPSEMEAWMTTVLGCANVDHLQTYVYGEKKALGVARDAVAAGNVAAILVDHQYMPGQKKGTFNIQDHWVLLVDVQSIGDRVKFRVMSWGQIYAIDLNTDRFEDLFMGVVIGYGPGSKN
jgi:hypothetical protein